MVRSIDKIISLVTFMGVDDKIMFPSSSIELLPKRLKDKIKANATAMRVRVGGISFDAIFQQRRREVSGTNLHTWAQARARRRSTVCTGLSSSLYISGPTFSIQLAVQLLWRVRCARDEHVTTGRPPNFFENSGSILGTL